MMSDQRLEALQHNVRMPSMVISNNLSSVKKPKYLKKMVFLD
jgi:hypothetical protein